MNLYRVVLPYACFGVEAERGVVVRAAPIGRWMVGKSLHDVSDWVVEKNGSLEIVMVHPSQIPPEDRRPRVIVCGTRDYADWERVYKVLDYTVGPLFLKHPIICHGAGFLYGRKEHRKLGTDYWAETWAMARGLTVRRQHPNFEKHGIPAAFHIRNREMVEYAASGWKGRSMAYCVAIWDGKSKGTKSVIDMCKKLGIRTKVVRYK